jgi:hypothetical protein
MIFKNLSDENLLRNNSLIIFASKREGASYKEMSVYTYSDGILDSLRDEGYRVFFGFTGLFAVDDLISTSTKHIGINLNELFAIEDAIERTKIAKDQRRH